MPKLTIRDNEYATLWYHPDSKVVHHTSTRLGTQCQRWITGPQPPGTLNTPARGPRSEIQRKFSTSIRSFIGKSILE